MKKMFIKIAFLCAVGIFIFFLPTCKTPPATEPEPEEPIIVEIEEEPDTDIIGTWFFGDQRSMLILQFRSDGLGAEINLEQAAEFSLFYRPFSFTITDDNISLSFSDSLRPSNAVYNVEKPSANRLLMVNYIRRSSPTFIRQELTELEGLWRRENMSSSAAASRANVDYLFGGRNFMVKLQNGIPIATGNFIISGTSVIINDLHRCIDYYSFRWTRSTAPHDTFAFRVSGNRLFMSSAGSEHLFIK